MHHGELGNYLNGYCNKNISMSIINKKKIVQVK